MPGEHVGTERQPLAGRVQACLAFLLAEQPDKVGTAVAGLLGGDAVHVQEVLSGVGQRRVERRAERDSSGDWPLRVCLGNDLSARVRRRRSGARCWLDQELVRLAGVTHYRPAAAVSLHQTGTTGPYERVGGSSRMLADELDYVIGVDTHRDEHVLAVLTAAAGAVVAGEALQA